MHAILITLLSLCVRFPEKEMLEERRLSSERLRQLEQVTQQLHVSHDSLDKAKAELAAVRAERDATVRGTVCRPRVLLGSDLNVV